MATGTRTTYTDTNLKPRSVMGMIHNIEWKSAALLKELGMDATSRFRFDRWPRTKYEWMTDTNNPTTSALAEALDDSETGVDVTASTGQYFKTGDILKVESELLQVVSVATDTLTVVRGFAGTTAASHNDTTSFSRVTTARLEGATTDTGYSTTTGTEYNYTQIFQRAVSVTGSEKVDDNYSVPDQMAYQMEKYLARGKTAGELPIDLLKTFFYGYRAVGSATTPRAMGGFNQFVTAATAGSSHIVNAAGASLTLKAIVDLMQVCYEDGGQPGLIITGGWGKRKISDFWKGQTYQERTAAEGGEVIDSIKTDFGIIDVLYERFCPTNEMYLVQKSEMGWLPYRPFAIHDRPASGDYELKEIIGEYGFALVNPKAHGKIYGFSTTA
jgi:hypothetical protein